MRKPFLPLLFLLLLTTITYTYATLLYEKRIEGTVTVNEYYDLDVKWSNGTEGTPRFDLGQMWIGDSKDVSSIDVTMLGDGGYLKWLYEGDSAIYVSCYEVDEGANVGLTHDATVTYTFNFWLREALPEGEHAFNILFEINDVIT